MFTLCHRAPYHPPVLSTLAQFLTAFERSDRRFLAR